jgi:hypothetical protein
MPDFGTPFAGLDLDRKMTKAEVVRALRFAIAAEYEAIQLYRQIAEATDEEFVADVMNEVADEEVVHAGEFLEVLRKIHPSEEKFYDEGAKEVNDHFGKKEIAGELVKIAKEITSSGKLRDYGLRNGYEIVRKKGDVGRLLDTIVVPGKMANKVMAQADRDGLSLGLLTLDRGKAYLADNDEV